MEFFNIHRIEASDLSISYKPRAVLFISESSIDKQSKAWRLSLNLSLRNESSFLDLIEPLGRGVGFYRLDLHKSLSDFGRINEGTVYFSQT